MPRGRCRVPWGGVKSLLVALQLLIGAHGDLFVIDHGSPTSPRLLLHPETNVVRLPRGVTDHAEIARFCSRFQRFLLSEYRWVLHTDADELLVHAQGNAALLARLARPNAAGSACILAPEHAVDVIQRLGDEGPLRLGEPLGPQRGFMGQGLHPRLFQTLVGGVQRGLGLLGGLAAVLARLPGFVAQAGVFLQHGVHGGAGKTRGR